VARSQEGELFAIGDLCTHGPVLLSEGAMDGESIECWGHGSRFCLRTGEPENLPATDPVPSFGVVEQDGAIYLELEGQ
jgi:3-phenylpropionate/trans-cinnamate dioxygenase ferredoxin subunit